MLQPILGAPAVTREQAESWAKTLGASPAYLSLVPLIWTLAPSHGGVRPEVALAQAALETACGRFGMVLDEGFRNPCGMKTTIGGGDYDPEAHTRFPCWKDGVTAQLDHLALYAGADGYPRPETKDPRHFHYLTGSARYVEHLGARWATGADYGFIITERYLLPLLQYARASRGNDHA